MGVFTWELGQQCDIGPSLRNDNRETAMPIFISYSRSDRDFVDRLAKQLVANKADVWLDKWEIHVGESLIDRIQAAITARADCL